MSETALHPRLVALGARAATRDGWTVARDLGDVAAEVEAARGTVAIADRGARAATLVHGRDAVRFLQGIVTNDVEALAVDDAAYALLLTPKARIVADMRLVRLAEDAFLVESEPGAGGPMRALFLRYRLAARVAIEPVDEAYGAIGVIGPRAAALVTAALGAAPAAGHEGAGVRVDTPAGALRVLATALGGLDVVGEAEPVAGAFDALHAALPAHGGRVAGADAWELARIAAGVPRFGAELDETAMPAEVGVVARAISFTKGCYPGQEPVARLHHRGHANRGLRALEVDGPVPPRGAALFAGEREVGRVTSAGALPGEPGPRALAVVRREVEEGDEVRIVWDDGEATARVHAPEAARGAA
jgi:folate-binding protein YgfZ